MPKQFKNSEEQDFYKQMSIIMDRLLSDGIKTKRAAEVGKRAVEYFRGNDFCRWLLQNNQFLIENHSDFLRGNTLQTISDAETIANKFIRSGFIYRAQYKPLPGSVDKSDSSVKQPKWPKRLQACYDQNFDRNDYYILNYEGNKRLHYLMLTFIIIGVLVLCMFPAWPLSVKIGMWYISVFLFSFILLCVVVRLVIFVLFWFFGFDLWLFPNLFNEECGLIDSFIPLHAWAYRKDSWPFFFTRIFFFVVLSAAIYRLGETNNVSDVGYFAKQSFLDVLEWGRHKLSAIPDSAPKYPGLADLESVTNIEDEKQISRKIDALKTTYNEIVHDDSNASCMSVCGYDSVDSLIRDCLIKCDCITRILEHESDCFTTCDVQFETFLHQAKSMACVD